MKHARDDYNRIQDPAGIIPADEPVFLLRGQDKFAAETLRYYAHLVKHQRSPDMKIVFATLKQADAMDAWPTHKAPDLPSPQDPERAK
jgi:hypothetical protein